LPLEGSHRCGIDDRPPLTAVEWISLCHRRSSQPYAVEGPDQIDFDDSLEKPQIVRLTIPAQSAGRRDDPSTIDQCPQRCHRDGGVDRSLDLFGIGYVGVHEGPTNLIGHGFTEVILQVDDHNPDAIGSQPPSCRRPEARCPTGDD
jgi:hypothetical protein